MSLHLLEPNIHNNHYSQHIRAALTLTRSSIHISHTVPTNVVVALQLDTPKCDTHEPYDDEEVWFTPSIHGAT